MRPSRTVSAATCAICERTLLVGERTTRFAPEGEDFVDVCPLCQELAAEQGWLKEGSPTTPPFAEEPRRKRFSLASFLDPRRAAPQDTLERRPEAVWLRCDRARARGRRASRRPASTRSCARCTRS